MRSDRTALIPLCLLLVATLAGDARGQATSASLVVSVSDPSGAALPGATVTAASEQTGLTRTSLTDRDGRVTVSHLPPDVYRVTAAHPGFKLARHTAIALAIDQQVRLGFTLALDDVAEAIAVRGDAPLLQTTRTDTGAAIERRLIQDLPLLGRNFLDLARLAAGTTTGGGGNTLNLSISGQRELGNAVIVDGIEVTGNRNNDTALMPALDAVQEFKVLTSGYAPEIGRAVGGAIAIQTRAGSNAWHGGLSALVRPTATAARTFFATARSDLDEQHLGGTLGGPIRRNRTFVFGAYERTRLRDTFAYLDSVPPRDQIRFLPNGDVDLSQLRDPQTGATIPIFDPAAFAASFVAQPFPGNVIPAARVSPAGRAILERLFPAPNRTGLVHGWFNNFAVRQAYAFDSDTLDGRIDHTLRDADRLSIVYHLRAFDETTGDRFAGAIPIAGGGGADDGERAASTNHALSLAWTRVLRRGWVAETRAGFNDFRTSQRSLVEGGDVASQLGLGRIAVPGFEATDGLPYIALGFGAYTGGSTFKPLRFHDRQVQAIASLAGQHGAHDLKVGVDLRRMTARPDFSLFPTGFFHFGGPYASLTSDPLAGYFDPAAFYGTGGSDVADLLLGLPLTASLGLQLTRPETRSWEAHAFVQDAWRIADRLVVLYGVRYEYQAPFAARGGQAANFDAAALALRVADRGSHSSALVRPDRNNVAPRVGVAWQITPRTVLRGAWGLFYSPENDARSDVLTKNHPFASREDLVNSSDNGPAFAYVLDTGVPRRTTIDVPSNGIVSATDVPNARNQVFYLVDPAFRTGRAQLFNVVLQRALTATLAADIGYVGAIGRDMPYAIGNMNRDGRLSSAIGRVEGQFPLGENASHALHARVTRRFSRGLSLLATYTFGKALDNGPAPFNLGRAHQQPQDPFDLDAEWAPSASDVRHTFAGAFLYELPFFRNATGVRRVLADWQINAIVHVLSGTPVNVVRNGRDREAPGLRPNLVGDAMLPRAARSLTRYFDVDAFSIAGLGAREPGSAGRNVVRGPGYANLDLSLFKTVRLGRGLTLQARVEAFNLTNTPHFANPNGDLSQGSVGTITHTHGEARILQFGARLAF